MDELNTKMNDEIRVRGQIIALSLKLEDILTKIIYSTFKPICENEEVLNLYLEEFILPIAFGKKISLFKQVLKTEKYQTKIKLYLESNSSITKNRNISTAKELTNFLDLNLSETLKTRNLIAHGLNVNDLVAEEVDLDNGNIIFANKLKSEILNKNSLKDFSENTLLISFIILMIRKLFVFLSFMKIVKRNLINA